MAKRTTTSSPVDHVLLQIKVTLAGAPCPIWRRLQVEGATTLERLHDILQTAMGWGADDLQGFRRPATRTSKSRHRFPAVDEDEESSVRLSDVLLRPKDLLVYDYDFGDAWLHEIVLEERMEPAPTVHCPRILDGRGACPPEDVRGVFGYGRILEAIQDPSDPEHEHWAEWGGAGFDPDAFNVQRVNDELQGRGRTRQGRDVELRPSAPG